MNCWLDTYTLGTYEFERDHVVEKNSNLYFNQDSSHEIRGKFFGLVVWSPLQGIGHVGLRLFHLSTGSFMTHGEEKAYEAFYDRVKEGRVRKGETLPAWEIHLYQLRQLIIDVSMLALFVIFGIAIKEVIALAGVINPFDARVAYGALERFFISKPKDPLNSDSKWLEFFTFSAPCMQTLDEDISLYKRRCEVLCPQDHIRYQPNITLGKLHILKLKTEQCTKYFLQENEKDYLLKWIEKAKETRKEIPVNVPEELGLIDGKPPVRPDQEGVLALRKKTIEAIKFLEQSLYDWSHGKETNDLVEFFEDTVRFDNVQKVPDKLGSDFED